jgi:hypothetical protein
MLRETRIIKIELQGLIQLDILISLDHEWELADLTPKIFQEKNSIFVHVVFLYILLKTVLMDILNTPIIEKEVLPTT